MQFILFHSSLSSLGISLIWHGYFIFCHVYVDNSDWCYFICVRSERYIIWHVQSPYFDPGNMDIEFLPIPLEVIKLMSSDLLQLATGALCWSWSVISDRVLMEIVRRNWAIFGIFFYWKLYFLYILGLILDSATIFSQVGTWYPCIIILLISISIWPS
jgi:hypothetical protein